MANKKHLEILKKGVKAWNEWRMNYPDIKPDLSKFNLRSANFFGADLRDANLFGVDFRRANLRRANLNKAYLGGANLIKADLSKADLRSANFSGADLFGANLSGADLSGANIGGADFSEANINRVIMTRTHFERTYLEISDFKDSYFLQTTISDCDLSNTIGLDSVKHGGSSTIGIDTILRSKGKIPISFLKGCGIPGNVVKTVLKLAKESASGFYSCFISYNHKNEIFAGKLKKDLEANNVNCWVFPEDAVWGRDIEENIDRGVRDYDKLIVICSENSLNSEPVLREIERALQKEQSTKEKYKKTKRILFPVIIDDYFYKKWDHQLKPLMLRIVYGDFRGRKDPTKYKKALNRLLEGLKK